MAGEFHYGGQAIIEGVMIRGKNAVGTAVRRPDGEIIVNAEPPRSLVQRYRWLNIPFLRGTPALIDSLRIGYRALMYSAEIQMEAEQELGPLQTSAPSERSWLSHIFETMGRVLATPFNLVLSLLPPKGRTAFIGFLEELLKWLTVPLAFAFGIFLFVIIPNQVLYLPFFAHLHPVVKNLIEGVLKILIMVSYILLIARMKHVRRLFQYHGAEHMVINAYEHGREPSVENAQDFSTIHTRCGTAFIALVLFVAIIVHLLAPWPKAYYLAIPLRILLILPIAGISYEILKFSATPKGAWLTYTLSAPGLWLQRITTQPPTPDQIEVAVAALKGVLEAEQGRGISGQEPETKQEAPVP